MTTVSANHGDLLEPGLRQILFNRFSQYPEEYAQVYKVDTSQKDREKESTLSGLGVMPEKDKGSAITYDDPYQGYDVTYTHITYAMGFRVERELWEDDLYGKIKRMPEALARSARAAYEVVA